MTPLEQSTQIGDVILTPLSDGRLELKIDDALAWTTWTPAGVTLAIDYLQTWLASQKVKE